MFINIHIFRPVMTALLSIHILFCSYTPANSFLNIDTKFRVITQNLEKFKKREYTNFRCY